ncbi:MAG TPA: hypothetical protein VH475_17655, partial [Tepidisphaeraceae bacterium]
MKALLIFAVLLVGCDGDTSTTTGGSRGRSPTQAVEPDTRPAFVLNPSKPFVIEFGRGSGRGGLDIVKVDQTGSVQLSRIAEGQRVESTSLRLSRAEVTALVGLVNTNQLTGMGRTYSAPGVADGTQWVLWIEQSPYQKSVYCNNSFPGPITVYASGLDG